MANEQPESETDSNRLSVAALRRSTTSHTPTRTMRLTEQEVLQRERHESPSLSLESLRERPRSNQRNRTPRRNESPLDPAVFRRERTPGRRHAEEAEQQHNSHAARITIRPGAGAAVGTVAPMRIREESPERSAKQGPSHRKIRRWNNDHFDKLAAELAPSSQKAATVLLQAQQDAHLYRSVYETNPQSKSMTQFREDDALQGVRRQFFEGELPNNPQQSASSSKASAHHREPQTSQEMLYRIDSRLRRVVTKACNNSLPAARVVKTFETFIVESFAKTKYDKKGKKKKTKTSTLPDDWHQDLLLEPPTVTQRKDNDKLTAQFYFNPHNATGGFHRLLLHAVCQFHGLQAVARTLKISMENGNDLDNPQQVETRALLVSGPAVADKFRLLSVLTDDDDDEKAVEALGTRMEEGWTVV